MEPLKSIYLYTTKKKRDDIQPLSSDSVIVTPTTMNPKHPRIPMPIKYFSHLALVIFLFAVSAQGGFAQQNKWALIIGIDKYMPPPGAKIEGAARSSFTDLNGCVNDGRSIYSIAVNRFMFPANQIDTLYNEAANREAILNGLNKLLNRSKRGDVAFIYYAGHGSRVLNSLSAQEGDKLDETMVPSDTWKPGVKDIRDKELAVIYNKFIDNGVILTVIMDCCHSGSLSRGPGAPGRFRFIADPNYDALDNSRPTPPEDRPEGTFLIMSAAQDNEHAQEQKDENNISHGAFTIAFMQALNQQSVDASAQNLFTSIRAILKSNGRKQEPVLGASAARQNQTLFGLSKGSVPDKNRVVVAGFEGNRVILQGGFAIGLYKENELAKFNGKDTVVKLRVDTVSGINRSIASIISGNIKDLKAGEYLDVTNWVSSGAPVFRVFVPTGISSPDALNKLTALSKELKNSTQVKWLNDLEKTDPYASIFLRDNKYYINIDDGKGVRELVNLSAKSVLSMIPRDSTVYVDLPITRETGDAIRTAIDQNRNIQMAANIDDANYVIYGVLSQTGKPSYGFRRSQISSKDSLEVMPVQTANFVLENNDAASRKDVADSLYEYALRLFRVRGWLQLTGPRKEKSNFPFHLELVNDNTRGPVGAEGARIGDAVSLHIVADSIVSHPNFNPGSIGQKYVYVFAVNKLGEMTLIFPDKIGGNLHNKFPQVNMSTGEINKDVTLVELEVGEPVGTDHIFLLATDEPIANYAMVFEQAGVRSQTMRGETNPLGEILDLTNNKNATRNYRPKTPSNWTLQKLQVKTRH